jgi:small membrane protein
MAVNYIFANITLLQILIMVFALFAWSRAIIRLKNKEVSIGIFLFWSLLWISVILIALFPNVLWGVSEIAGVGRAVDLLVYGSIIIMFYMIFRLYIVIDEKNREMTSLVREIAIRDAKDAKQKNGSAGPVSRTTKKDIHKTK